MSGEQQPGCPSRESAVSTAAHSRSGVFQSSRKQNSFHFVFLLNWLRTQAFNAFALSVSRTFPSTVLSPGDQGSRVPKDMVLSRRVMAHLLLTCPSLLTRRINYFQFFLSIHPSYSPTQMFQFVSSKITWVDPARWLCNWKGSPTSLRKEQVEAKNQLGKVVLWPSCSRVCTCILMLTHIPPTHTHINN